MAPARQIVRSLITNFMPPSIKRRVISRNRQRRQIFINPVDRASIYAEPAKMTEAAMVAEHAISSNFVQILDGGSDGEDVFEVFRR